MNRYTTQRLFGIAVRAAASLVVGVLLLVVGVTVARGGEQYAAASDRKSVV